MKKIVSMALLSLMVTALGCASQPAAPPASAPPPAKTATPVPAPSPAPVPTPTPATTPAPTQTPIAKPVGELRVALAYLGAERLDPIGGATSGIQLTAELMYDYVVGITLDGKMSTETGLANKWEMTPDAKKWTFYLRKGVKFHNGDEVTAEDIKFSIERIISEPSLAAQKSYFKVTMERMEVPDPYTFVYYAKEPVPLLHYYLSPMVGAEGMVVPKKYIQQVGETEFARHPVGSGPYRLLKQELGSYIEFEAVDEHWRVGKPKFKKITLLLIPELSTRLAMLKAGWADIIETSSGSVPEIKKAGFRVATKPDARLIRLMMTMMWEDVPVANQKVRLALSLAINREEILAHIFYGLGKIPTNPHMVPFSIGFDPTLKPDPYDPERARQLLAEAGYPKGFTINIISFEHGGVSEIPVMKEAIASYWAKVGVKANIIPMDYAAWRLKLADPNYKGSVFAPAMGTRVWALPLYEMHFRYPEGRLVLANDEELQRLMDEAMVVLGEKEREEAMRRVVRRSRDQVWTIDIVSLSLPYGIGDKVKSWTIPPSPYGLGLDQVVPKE